MEERIDFIDKNLLLDFLCCHKTELSHMDNPLMFVRQLRDNSLISEERYKCLALNKKFWGFLSVKEIHRMINEKAKEETEDAMYNALDWIQTNKKKHIDRFWKCLFKKPIMNKYPTLRELQKELFKEAERNESVRLEGVQNTVRQVEVGERKTARPVHDDDDEEQPGPSSQVTPPSRKKPNKSHTSSPPKKKETLRRLVTCGNKKGYLYPDRLAKSKECILVGKHLYTPPDFERLGGKESCKNWKTSICYRNKTLKELIQEGHLKCRGYTRASKAKKSLFPSKETTTVSALETEDDDQSKDSAPYFTDEQEDIEEETQLQSEVRNIQNRVLSVVCEDITGLLHTKRFASGTCGRSIRTETRWMTPVDFVKEASCQTDASWKKEIKCEGKPLGELIKAKILEIHSLLCTCSMCVPDSEDLDNEKNDDECWICRRNETEEEEKLVVCDECPRSFHQKCHLPPVEDALLDDDRPWMCALCVFIKNLDLYPELEMEAAMASSISGHMQHCQYLLLGLYRADEDCVFTADPSLILTDYTSVIRTPMWLGRVADKLQEKSYQTVGDFVSDVQLIFTNCASYNQNNPEFHAIGIKMAEFFKRELNTVFKIQEVAS